MGEKPTEDEESDSTRLVAGSAAAGAVSSSSRAALPEPVAASTTGVVDEAPAEEALDETQPVRFAYVCYHCGAHREVDSEGYVSDCATCGQSLESGRAQMEAVARGEHVPTYDRTSPYFP